MYTWIGDEECSEQTDKDTVPSKIDGDNLQSREVIVESTGNGQSIPTCTNTRTQ